MTGSHSHGHHEHLHNNPAAALKVAQQTMGVVAVMIIIKIGAWLVTGSVSLLASLVDSIIDAVISGLNVWVVKFSMKPADDNHRYGHGKVEGIAALGQAFFIGAAALFLISEAARNIFAARPVDNEIIGAAAIIISLALTFVILVMQRRAMKEVDCLAIEADHAHYASDVLLHAGILAVLANSYLGGPWWIDPVFGIGVGGYLLHMAWGVGVKAVDMLMDAELPDETRHEIVQLAQTCEGVMGIHDLRTHKSGMKVYVTMDIDVDPNLSLRAGHDIALCVEQKIMKAYPQAEVMIHVDPYGEPDDMRHDKFDEDLMTEVAVEEKTKQGEL